MSTTEPGEHAAPKPIGRKLRTVRGQIYQSKPFGYTLMLYPRGWTSDESPEPHPEIPDGLLDHVHLTSELGELCIAANDSWPAAAPLAPAIEDTVVLERRVTPEGTTYEVRLRLTVPTDREADGIEALGLIEKSVGPSPIGWQSAMYGDSPFGLVSPCVEWDIPATEDPCGTRLDGANLFTVKVQNVDDHESVVDLGRFHAMTEPLTPVVRGGWVTSTGEINGLLTTLPAHPEDLDGDWDATGWFVLPAGGYWVAYFSNNGYSPVCEAGPVYLPGGTRPWLTPP